MANVNDIYQIRVACQNASGNQASINIMHYICTAKVGTGATDLAIASSFRAALANPYKAWLANVATFRGVGAKCVWPVPTVEQVDVSAVGAGSGGADQLPNQVCGLLAFYTNTPGRRGRGRLYVPFGATAWMNANGEQTAAGTVILAAINTAIPGTVLIGGGGNTNSFAFVVYNKTTHGVINVITWIARTGWATQRRRGDYGRPNALPF